MSIPLRAPEPTALFCYGFGMWKQAFVRAFLRDIPAPVHFVAGPLHARLRKFGPGARLIVWGRRESPGMMRLAQRCEVPVWRMEDGFLRSVGLGTDFRAPSSLVLDTRGIYFDPRSPSDLEHILEHAQFEPDELARASALRREIVRRALSKYNFGAARGRSARPDRARVVLVPGQVEEDASIVCGAPDIKTNLALLEAVRREAPDAYIIYKPHPDVLSGNRREGVLSLARARALADEVVTDVPLPACLDRVDEVHTMTSLVGFEALLREKRVVCHGSPFYSGWGLTEDRHRIARRTRRLTLDMLVAGTLIRYPRYLRQSDWQLTTPETIVEELGQTLATAAPTGLRNNQVLRRARMVFAGLRGMFGNGT